jgi:hypothetical protein
MADRDWRLNNKEWNAAFESEDDAPRYNGSTCAEALLLAYRGPTDPLADYLAEGGPLSDMNHRVLAEWILTKEKWPPGRGPGSFLSKTAKAERWAARRVMRAKKRWLKQHPGRKNVPGVETTQMIAEAIEAAKKRFGRSFITNRNTPNVIRGLLQTGRL